METGSTVLLVVNVPVNLPEIAYWTLPCVIIVLIGGAIWHFRRRPKPFREYLFEPIKPSDMPEDVRQYLETHTAAMLQIGLVQLGDYILELEASPVIARYFMSDDGRTFASVEDYHGTKTFEFFSVLADGTYVGSSPLAPANEPPSPEDHLHFEWVKNAPTEDLYIHHLSALQRLESQHGAAQKYQPEQFREVVSYGHRLVGWSLFRQGYNVEPPSSIR